MEYEDLKERMDEEARRVAAAFGLETLELVDEDRNRDYRGELGPTLIQWTVDSDTIAFSHIAIGWNVDASLLEVWPVGQERQWDLTPSPLHQFNDLMVRGLYCLGFEDEGVLSQLPPLSNHEKLELRLSLPREFWPQKWRDEEGE
jgi:hypothetical protein